MHVNMNQTDVLCIALSDVHSSSCILKLVGWGSGERLRKAEGHW